MNNIVVVGRLVRDVEKKISQKKTEYCQFSIADNSNQKNVLFLNCYMYENLERVEKWRKGDMVSVVGKLNVNQKEEKTYVNIFVDNVSFLSSKSFVNSPEGDNEEFPF